MAQSVQQTIEIPLLPFRRLGCAGSASSSGAGVEKTAVSHIALVRSRVQTWRTRLRSHSCSLSMLVYVHVRQVPQVQSWKRQLKSHSCSPLTLGLGVQVSRFHRCSLRGDSRDPTVAARSCRSCSTLTRWSMSWLWFTCLSLFNDSFCDGCASF